MDSKEAVDLATGNNPVTTDGSLDVKTIQLVNRLYERNRESHDFYRKAVSNENLLSSVSIPKNTLILFVPGFMYKADQTTGADFQKQRDLLSNAKIPFRLIEIKENGLVDENAKSIADHINFEAKSGKELILVSASKGGLETSVALGKYISSDSAKKIKAWISIGGIHRGTYLADHAMTFPRSILARLVGWIEGFEFDQVADMTVRKNKPMFESLVLPENIYYLQFIGVPLSGQVSDEIDSRYYELAQYGPNDGLTTIEHQIISNASVVVELGLDHYYRDKEIDKKTLSLLALALKEISDRQGP
ncbi:MAG: hypothetical protein KDD68_20240 [Bdellovibrionales bacterium]|nr:hypothetical protein [Bdellovibrionales bacterium]